VGERWWALGEGSYSGYSDILKNVGMATGGLGRSGCWEVGNSRRGNAMGEDEESWRAVGWRKGGRL
jgi:hypothetical protein